MKKIIYTKQDLINIKDATFVECSDDFAELFVNLLERAINTYNEQRAIEIYNEYNEQEEKNAYTAVSGAIDEGLLSYAEQRTVLIQYCTPKYCDYEEVIDQLTIDLDNAINYLIYLL